MNPTMSDSSRAMDLAYEAGTILLENGAEISRVEETMQRIASHYGVEDKSFFVLISGIFPLVPGAGIFWTSYNIVSNQLPDALHTAPHSRLPLPSHSAYLSSWNSTGKA